MVEGHQAWKARTEARKAEGGYEKPISDQGAEDDLPEPDAEGRWVSAKGRTREQRKEVLEKQRELSENTSESPDQPSPRAQRAAEQRILDAIAQADRKQTRPRLRVSTREAHIRAGGSAEGAPQSPADQLSDEDAQKYNDLMHQAKIRERSVYKGEQEEGKKFLAQAEAMLPKAEEGPVDVFAGDTYQGAVDARVALEQLLDSGERDIETLAEALNAAKEGLETLAEESDTTDEDRGRLYEESDAVDQILRTNVSAKIAGDIGQASGKYRGSVGASRAA